jgi:CheY-like chemotaxis protein
MMSKLHPTVLLVDDDFAVANMYLTGLEHAGLSVTTAGSGKAALAAIAYEVPDVVVIDWNLPGMRGDELLAVLRDNPRTARLPVLFLSVFAADEVRPMRLVREERSMWLTKTKTTPARLAEHVLNALGTGRVELPQAIA